MNISRFIASRYLFSKKSKNIINIISFISVIGIFVSSSAMIIVLSGFNGIEGLVADLYSKHHSDLTITPNSGKTFTIDSLKMSKIKSCKGVHLVSCVIEETTMIKKGDRWVNAIMKGVEESYLEICELKSTLLENETDLNFRSNQAVLGLGLYNQISGPYREIINTITVYGLLRDEKIKRNSKNAFKEKMIEIGGVFNINPELNNEYFIVPINFAKNLLNYNKEITSVEIGTHEDADVYELKAALKEILGDAFVIKTNFEKNELIFKTNAAEKWMVFLILIFILILSTFNIIASLTMLILDKKKDISTLISLGATQRLIRNIFFKEGLYINLIGGVFGLIFGVLVCLVQKHYHIIKLENSVVPYWPVDVALFDIISVMIILLLIGLAASFIPTNYLIKKHFKQFFY